MTLNQQTNIRRTAIRRTAAAVAAGSVLALGALGVVMGEQRDPGTLMSDDPTVAPVTTPSMTLGETSTTSVAPTSPETPVATPEITATSVEPG